MGATELRDQTLKRQRELASRHEVLDRLDAEPERYADQFARVLDATNDLIVVLDRVDARAARRRLVVAFVLLGVTVVVAVLVAIGALAAYWLIGGLLVLTAAVTLWLGTRSGAGAGPEAGA